MDTRQSFRIITDDRLLSEQFSRWHQALISQADHQSATIYVVRALGMKFALRANSLSVPGCDLTWGLEAVGRTVQINPAGSAGDANVLSAIAEDVISPGQFAVLRQGRLHPNHKGGSQIRGGAFRHAFQKLPVNTSGSFGAKGREWYLVCNISEDLEKTVSETADFVERCALVRATFARENA